LIDADSIYPNEFFEKVAMKSSYVDEEIREVLSDRDDAIFAEYLFACFCSDAPPRRLCAWTPTRIGQCYIA
jgi:hypothetical protein